MFIAKGWRKRRDKDNRPNPAPVRCDFSVLLSHRFIYIG
jgi:hypothetical protein